MASLKDLRLRIKSVKSTQKITKAMKLVAASKLRRARERAEAARPYTTRMESMLANLSNSLQQGGAQAPALLGGNGRDQVHLLLVATSDRGLCGGFNVQIVREVKRTARHLLSQGKQIKIMPIGRKGYELLRREFADHIVHRYTLPVDKHGVTYDGARSITEDVMKRFEAGEFDVCHYFYSVFHSAISQKPTQQQLIPFLPAVQEEAPAHGQSAMFEYEPSEGAILEDILPRNLAVQLYRGLLENTASEQGARMTAMDNATRNAGDMIGRLTLQYNRSRQAAITTELTEIVAGAEAV